MIKPLEKIPNEGYVLFSASWCGPCKAMHPVLEKLPAVILEVNIDEHKDIAGMFGIMSVPTIVKMAKGKPIAYLVGGQSAAKIAEFVR